MGKRVGIGIAIGIVVVALWLHAGLSAFHLSSTPVVSGGYIWGTAHIPGDRRSCDVVYVSPSGTVLVGGREPQIARSTDGGSSWEELALTRDCPVQCIIASQKGTLFAGTGAGLYRSTDDGKTWALVGNGLQVTEISCLAATQQNRVILSTGDGSFCSDDDGTSWKKLTKFGKDSCAECMCSTKSGALFSGAENRGLYRSLDNGQHWSAVASEFAGKYTRSGPFEAIADDSNGTVYAAGTLSCSGKNDRYWRESQLIRSRDGGDKWEKLAFADGPTLCCALAIDQRGQILVGTEKGLYISSDAIDWVPVGMGGWLSFEPPFVRSIAVDSTGKVYVLGFSGEVFIGTPIKGPTRD